MTPSIPSIPSIPSGASPAPSARKLPKQAKHPTGQDAADILSHAQSSREFIQDFVPLADSLEWELGQKYLRDRGNKCFISDAAPVPFVINNDGNLSRNAAEVFFASLVKAESNDTLEPDIFVLELGIGVGLFARFFLDHFRNLCRDQGKDYYDRLTYIAADKSERMLTDVLRHGVLANHPGRYRVRQVDALEPEKHLAGDVAFLKHPRRASPFRAVFLNYLLDCLPAAVLELEGEQVRQLFVRTCLARSIQLADYTDMTIEQLQERATSADPRAKQDLLEVYGLFASEYDYRPIEVQQLPFGDFAFQYARKVTKRLLLSYGAMHCLERLLALVADDGFILINDYGQTQTTSEDEFEHQRFSLATFVGLNFPLLKAYFQGERRCEWAESTAGEGSGIHSRLLSRQDIMEVRSKFHEVFGHAAQERLQEPLIKARACVRMGRFELAGTYYRQALELQPRNWVLLNEVSMFLTFSLRDPKAGIDMARMALRLNPTCSAELWNALGDALYEYGRIGESRSAYQKALDVNDSDVRARYNLAWVYVREKSLAAALNVIAEGLALDKTGEYRERLLQKQHEVLALLAVRNQQEYLLLINLVSKYAKDKEVPARKDEGPVPPERRV